VPSPFPANAGPNAAGAPATPASSFPANAGAKFAPANSSTGASEASSIAEGLTALIEDLSEQMRTAAGSLNFELAARLRDEVADLKKELREVLR
jgi:excinuclease ABC subunit B